MKKEASGKTKPRRWRRLAAWTLILAVVLFLIVRISLPFVLPAVLEKTAAGYGLHCAYERLDLSLITTDLELWHLEVWPDDSDEPCVHVEYCRADLSVFDLFTGDLVVRRVEVDGMDLELQRTSDGRFPLFEHFAAETPVAEPEAEEEEPPEPSTSVLPVLAFEVNALRFQHVQTRFVDESVTPPIDTRFDLNFRLSDLGSETRNTRLLVTASSPPILDTLTLEGACSLAGAEPFANLSLRINGLHPEPLAGYLAPAGIQALAERLDFSLSAQAQARKLSTEEAEIEVYEAGVRVDRILAQADGAPVLSLDRIEVSVDRLEPGRMDIASLVVDGGWLGARIREQGDLQALGFLFTGGSQTEAEPEPEEPAVEETQATDPLALTLKKAVLQNFQAELLDGSVSPEVGLDLVLEELAVTDFSSVQPGPMGIHGRLAASGVLDALEFDGQVSFMPPAALGNLDLRARAVTLEALAPYLAASGIESTLRDGSFNARLQAAFTQDENRLGPIELSLTEVTLQDGEDQDREELLGLDRFNLTLSGIDSLQNRIDVERIEVLGPRCRITRGPAGDLELLGLRLGKAPARVAIREAPPAPAAPATPATSPAEAVPLVCAIERILLDDARVSWLDQSVEPPVPLLLEKTGLELTSLLIDFNRQSLEKPVADLKAWVAMPGLVEKITIEGKVVPRPDAPSLELTLDGQGITARGAAQLLQAAGVEPALQAGTLHLRLAADLALTPEALLANLALTDLSLADGGEELLALQALRLNRCHVGPEAVRIEALEIERPAARLARTPEGNLTAAGFVFSAPPQQEAAAPATDPQPAPQASGPAPAFSLERFQIREGVFDWSDQSLASAPATRVSLAALVKDLAFGQAPRTASLDCSLAVAGALDQLTLKGRWTLGTDRMDGALTIDGQGLRAGPLSAYLPEGIESCLEDGRLRLGIRAAYNPHDAGGQTVRFELHDLDYRDGEDGPALLRIKAIRALASRLDPEAGVFDLGELSMQGTTLLVEKTAEGGNRLLGLNLGPAPEKTAPPAEEAEAAKPRPKLLTRLSSGPLPRVSLNRLDLQVESLKITDQSRPDAAPLALADFRLHNPQPLIILGEDPETQAPLELTLAGNLAPALERFSVDLSALPFAPVPELNISVLAEGLQGRALVDLAPGLEETIDGRELVNGCLHATLATTLELKKRHPLDLDLNQPFGFTFSLKDLALKAGKGGPVLAGLEELYVEGARVDPVQGAVHLRCVEMVKPQGVVSRKEDGLHLLGLTLLPSPEAPEKPEEPAAEEPVAEAVAPTEPGPEFRVDRVLLSEIDFTFTDETADPPMPLPLRDLDLEVKGFTTRAFNESLPIRFSLYLGAGEVPLRPRDQSSGLAGLLGDAIDMVAGEDAPDLEQRKLFEEIAVSGSLEVYPNLRGWVKAGISAMELANFEGTAGQSGVTLTDGVLDSGVSLYFKEDGSLVTESAFTFTDLSLSEAEGGPISRYLKLPAPLDVVVFLIRDEDGAVKIPLDFHVGADGVSGGEIAQVAATTLGTLIANAVASSPFRVAGTLTDFIPFGEEEEVDTGEPALSLTFAGGETYLTRSGRDELGTLCERLEEEENLVVTLQHMLGPKDLAQAGIRANPSPENCLELATRLRQRQQDLMVQRHREAAQVRAGLATGLFGRDQSDRDVLEAIDRDLGFTGLALDRILALLRPGAERQASRRTREACIAIGAARLEAVKQALERSELSRIDERIRVKRSRFSEPEDDAPGRIVIHLNVSQELE